MCDLWPWCVTLSKSLNLSGLLVSHLLRSLVVLWLGVKLANKIKDYLLLFCASFTLFCKLWWLNSSQDPLKPPQNCIILYTSHYMGLFFLMLVFSMECGFWIPNRSIYTAGLLESGKTLEDSLPTLPSPSPKFLEVQ